MKPERSFTRPRRSLWSKILCRGDTSTHNPILLAPGSWFLAPGLSALRYGLLIFFFLEPGFQSAEAGSASTKAGAFLQAYPNFFSGFKDNTLLFRDGGGIQFDDGRSKTYEELLSHPDPEDELSQNYPTGSQSFSPPAVNFDPGRYRCAALFKKMYGENPKEVESHLATIPWLPHSTHTVVRITRVNGVDRQLKAVSAELDQLPLEEKKYVLKTGGTFNWRPIAGSEQLSAHAFGIAIDIDPDYSDYWRWNASGDYGKLIPYKNRIPHRIVEIFERHGFIWGGKWYHYDTMHFEYRPELLPQAAK